MSTLMLEFGSQTLAEIDAVPVPQATHTYTPISHLDYIQRICKYAGMHCDGEQRLRAGLKNEGQQLFGMLQVVTSTDTDMSLSIGFRSSYDKTLSAGLCAGSSVFVCSNGIFSGDCQVLRKHTSNILNDIDFLVDHVISTAYPNHEQNKLNMDAFKAVPISDREAFQFLGLAYGNDVLLPRQLSKAKAQWVTPNHDEFGGSKNVYRLYQACTEALKTSDARTFYTRHANVNSLAVDEFLGSEPVIEPVSPVEVSAGAMARFSNLDWN